MRASQVNARREHGGTGLGLFISMKLVQQMGGSLGMESEGEGRGAKFWFEVPLRVLQSVEGGALTVPDVGALAGPVAGGPPAAVTLPASGTGRSMDPPSAAIKVHPEPAVTPPPASCSTAITAADGATAIAPITSPVHILIVDDVASIRMLMHRLLKRYAPLAVISEAEDGEKACELMEAAKATASPLFTNGVICMDKEMPVCDGFEATQRIRASGFRGLILGVTGNAIQEDVEAFLGHGAEAVVTKPVSFPVLMGYIRKFVSERVP